MATIDNQRSRDAAQQRRSERKRAVLGLGLGLGLAACGDLGLGEMEVERVALSLVPVEELRSVVHENAASPVRADLMMPLGKSHTDAGILPTLRMAPPAEVTYELQPLDGAELRFAAGIGLDSYQEERGDVRFELLIDGESVFDRTLGTGPDVPREDRVWHRASTSIASGGRVTLRTTRVGGDDGAAPIDAGFGLLELVTRRSVRRTRASKSEPNVILVTIDTLRADALSAYGHDRPTSPEIDGLAARGTLFERAYAPSPWTWPSTATLLTGLVPPEHGLLDYESCYLSDELETLAEVFQAEGFTTAAYAANPLIVANKNFDQGFERFKSWEWAPARDVMAEVVRFVDRKRDLRFFVYVHLIDPHGPYEPEVEFREAWAPPEPEGMGRENAPFKPLLEKWYAGEPYDETRLDQMTAYKKALYDGEVATVDRQIGELLRALEEFGLDETTVVALTSDHGEEFLENGMLAHGKQLYDSSVRVPLILAGPGVPAGERSDVPVENRFVGRTLLDLAGVEPPAEFARGRNLIELGRSDPAEEPIFFTNRRGRWLDWDAGRAFDVLGLHAVDVGGLRLMWNPDEDGTGGRTKLFDLDDDPAAAHDLARERPNEVQALRTLIRDWLDASESRRPDVLDGGSIAEDQLRALGYLDGE